MYIGCIQQKLERRHMDDASPAKSHFPRLETFKGLLHNWNSFVATQLLKHFNQEAIIVFDVWQFLNLYVNHGF